MPLPRGAGSVFPEVFEARRRQLRVAHGVLDVAVTEIRLQRAGIDALVGEVKSAGMPQHMRMRREFELGSDTQPSDQLPETCGGERCAPFRGEYERRRWILLAFEPPQAPELASGD